MFQPRFTFDRLSLLYKKNTTIMFLLSEMKVQLVNEYMIRLFLFHLLVFHIALHAGAQDIYVPYRIGDKFGITTPSGTMKVEARYDYVVPCNSQGYFVASSYENNELKTDLIHMDKIIISNKGYADYEIKNNLVVATYIDNREGLDSWRHLYSDKGKILSVRSFRTVFIPQGEYAGNDGKYIVIYGADEKDHVNVYLYNTTKREISESLIENELALRTGYEVKEGKDTTAVIYTRDPFMTYHKYSVQSDKAGNPTLVNQLIENYNEVMSQEIIPDDAAKFDNEPDFYLKDISEDYYGRNAQVTTVELVKNVRSSVPFRLEFSDDRTLSDYTGLIKENGKIGVGYGGTRGSIPAIYDSIYFIIAHYPKPITDYLSYSHSSEKFRSDIGYVTKDKNKYGLILRATTGYATTLSPRFDYLPAHWYFDFGKKGFHLFALCDREGQFVCYADGDGRLYYKK